ncbi:hypothetical protein ASPWEDRAFT_585622 [Aspergillus wentii DTO 134E9]|uniref:Uncharacterized protein n=1 Tax=Aspergillus wentii DTO 134E9 TaxID=1073089 RepID=A0A1L9RI03_ASPWE|nr:uncharacterized protein ASPWEDRAFT_585622 [Aspergillus wentii DTO 134E9]OJJ34551.1 hypothetical protein ASPWEDRAFT_585622 [Aspergillus wentii DTO 134E9]
MSIRPLFLDFPTVHSHIYKYHQTKNTIQTISIFWFGWTKPGAVTSVLSFFLCFLPA